MKRLYSSILVIFLFIVFLGVARAGQDEALNWLRQAGSSTGVIQGEDSSVSMVYQSRFEAFYVLSKFSIPGPGGALSGIGDESTEAISKALIASSSPIQVNSLRDRLLARQNPDGGFGFLEGWESNTLDTAFALLAMPSGIDGNPEIKGIQYLMTRQRADGSFLSGKQNSIYVSSLVLHALLAHKNVIPAISASVIKKVVGYFSLNQLRPGVWVELPESIFLNGIIMTALYDFTESVDGGSDGKLSGVYQGFSEWAISLQGVNGSWGDDPFVTAWLLRGLALAQSNPINPLLAGLSLRVDDTESRLPLQGVTIEVLDDSGDVLLSKSTAGDGVAKMFFESGGVYKLRLSKSGYVSAVLQLSLQVGKSVDYGRIMLSAEVDSSNYKIIGKVFDAKDSSPLAGAIIRVTGEGGFAKTLADGSYQLNLPSAGAFDLVANFPGYSGLSRQVNIRKAGTMEQDFSLDFSSSYEGEVSGRVITSAGHPLAQSSINAFGHVVGYTDANGYFILPHQFPGMYEYAFSKEGYLSGLVNVDVTPGGKIDVGSVILDQNVNGSADDFSGYSEVVFSVVDKAFDDPVPNGKIMALHYDPTGSVVYQTQYLNLDGEGKGKYRLAPGRWRFYPLHPAYLREPDYFFSHNLSLASGGKYSLLFAIPFSPYSVNGVAVDSKSSSPLGRVKYTVRGRNDVIISSGESGLDGKFSIPQVEPRTTVTFESPSYMATTRLYDRAVNWSGKADVGEIRMRQLSSDEMLPDFVVKKLDISGLISNSNNTVVGGYIVASVRNNGSVSFNGHLDFIAFVDLNKNQKRDEGESIIGRIERDISLIGSKDRKIHTDVVIPVSGVLPFRDYPISIKIDSDEVVAEGRENNNFSNTAEAVAVAPHPGTINPVLKMDWVSPSANYPVTSTPLVARLYDDNQDGVINVFDTPRIIAPNGSDGLYVVNGATGNTERLIRDSANPFWGVRFGVPAIADIDHDGEAEIIAPSIYGLTCFRPDGRIKWQRNDLAETYGFFSDPNVNVSDIDGDGFGEIIYQTLVVNFDGRVRFDLKPPFNRRAWEVDNVLVTDLDLDGKVELVQGSAVYNNAGQLVNLGIGEDRGYDGFMAVANLFNGKYPNTISTSNGGVLNVFDYMGKLIWSAAGSGPVVISDFDGDGDPDIGVGTDSQALGGVIFRVYRNDGSVMWETEGSGGGASTFPGGASSFDIDQDGLPEIMFSDSYHFYILKGDTGHIMAEMPIKRVPGGARTPIVVDVDGDGHADVLVPEGAVDSGPTYPPYRGFKIFSGAFNDWPATRSTWNQLAYRETNINDDLSVPVIDASWRDHNTFNHAFGPRPESLYRTDLSASVLRVIDGISGVPAQFIVRVGNAGNLPVPAGIGVSFYSSDPSNGGTLIGVAQTKHALERAEWEDVTLEYPAGLASLNSVYAVVNIDANGQTALTDDFRVNNNQTLLEPVSLAVVSPNLSVALSTDSATYGANTPVTLQLSLENNGSLAASTLTHLKVVDAEGAMVADLGPVSLNIAAAASAQSSLLWNTGSTLSGNYRVVAETQVSGQVVKTAEYAFAITPGDQPPMLSSVVQTDKLHYGGLDTAVLTARVGNLTPNHPFGDLSIRLRVTAPDGAALMDRTESLGPLAVGGRRDLPVSLVLGNAAPGAYAVVMTVLDGQGLELGQSTARFDVDSSAANGEGISGLLQPVPSRFRGETIPLAYTILNEGNAALNAAPVRVQVVNATTAQAVLAVPGENLSLIRGQSTGGNLEWTVTGAYNTPLVALLQVQAGDQWRTLSQQPFQVLKPQPVLQVATDKPEYAALEQVKVDSTIRNPHNMPLTAVQVITSVTTPEGQVRDTRTQAVTVSSQASLGVSQLFETGRAQPGLWHVQTLVTDADGVELARQTSGFTVLSSAVTGTGLSGTVTTPATVVKGDQAVFAWTLNNGGNAMLDSMNLRLVVTDANGAVLSTLGSTVTGLALDATAQGELGWPVTAAYGSVVRGEVQIHVNGQWKPLADAILTVSKPLVSATVATDKGSYDLNDTVTLSGDVFNQSSVALTGVKAVTTVTRPDGSVAKSETTTLDLNAQSHGALSGTLPLNRAAAGGWTVTTVVTDADGVELARQSSGFTVLSSAVTGTGLSGTVTATPTEVNVGDTVTFALQMKNLGNVDLSNLPVTLSIRKNLDIAPVKTLNTTVALLAQDATAAQALSWVTTGSAGDTFVASLTVTFNGQTRTLASTSFLLKAATTQIGQQQEVAGTSRVLVYYNCEEDWYKGMWGWHFGDHHHSCFGNRAATLRGHLDALGVTYSLTPDEDEFLKLFRSGRYNTTMLLGAIEKLPEDLEDELHEAVNRGESLWLDGGMQTWYNHEIYDIGGVKYRGRLNFSDSRITPMSPVFTNTTAIGKPHTAGWPLYLKPTTGTVTATYGVNQCNGVKRDWIREKEDEDRDFYSRPTATYPAMVSNVYGKGRALSFAFDLTSSLANQAEQAQWQAVLLQGLAWTQPSATGRTTYVPHETVTLRNTLSNPGTSTAVRVRVELPVGAVWLGGGAVAPDRSVTLNLTLPAQSTQSLLMPVMLPTLAGEHAVKVLVQTTAGQTLSFQEQRFTVQTAEQRLPLARMALEQLVLNKSDDKLRDRAVQDVNDAMAQVARGRLDDAIHELGDAVEQLRDISGRDISRERLMLDDAMKALGIKWFDAQR